VIPGRKGARHAAWVAAVCFVRDGSQALSFGRQPDEGEQAVLLEIFSENSVDTGNLMHNSTSSALPGEKPGLSITHTIDCVVNYPALKAGAC